MECVTLASNVSKIIKAIATYQAHESVRVVLLLLPSAAIGLALGAELLAHSGAVVVHLSWVRDIQYQLVVEL